MKENRSKFNTYSILESINKYQETPNQNKRSQDEITWNTINALKGLRTDIKMKHDHECSVLYCEPKNITAFYNAQQCFGVYDTDAFVCKYGRVHICNHMCPTQTITSERVICPLTDREKINISMFSADKLGIISYDGEAHVPRKKLKMDHDAHIQQDKKFNNITTQKEEGLAVIKKMAAKAERPYKKIAHRKKQKPTKKVKFTPKQKHDTLERWVKYCSQNLKFGHDYFISQGAELLMDNMLNREKLLISSGDLRIHKLMREDPRIPKQHVDMIEAFEDVLEKVVPGLFRLHMEEPYIETQVKLQYSMAIKYMHQCKETNVLPNAFEYIKLIDFDTKKYLSVLTNWCTWKDWCDYINVIVWWWFVCENTLVSNEHKCKSLDYTQHALTTIYHMRDGYKITEDFDQNIVHPLIAQDYKLSCQDYVMRVNRLTSCGIIRKAYNHGNKAMKTCINQKKETIPIKEFRF